MNSSLYPNSHSQNHERDPLKAEVDELVRNRMREVYSAFSNLGRDRQIQIIFNRTIAERDQQNEANNTTSQVQRAVAAVQETVARRTVAQEALQAELVDDPADPVLSAYTHERYLDQIASAETDADANATATDIESRSEGMAEVLSLDAARNRQLEELEAAAKGLAVDGLTTPMDFPPQDRELAA